MVARASTRSVPAVSPETAPEAVRVRRFNRFYTRQMGLLHANHLQTGFSLPDSLDFSTFKTAWTEGNFSRGLVNSAIVALVKQREAGVEHLWSPDALRRHVLEGHKAAPGFGY